MGRNNSNNFQISFHCGKTPQSTLTHCPVIADLLEARKPPFLLLHYFLVIYWAQFVNSGTKNLFTSLFGRILILESFKRPWVFIKTGQIAFTLIFCNQALLLMIESIHSLQILSRHKHYYFYSLFFLQCY